MTKVPGLEGMVVAYGIGPTLMDPAPHPFVHPYVIPHVPVPVLPEGFAAAVEAVRLALEEEKRAERALAEAQVALDAAKTKHRAAVEYLGKIAGGQL